ncbi:MAG TPA: MFS transporter [Gemmatimonadaceae bacterium]
MTNRRALFVIACLGLLTFGIVMTTLGAVLPRVIEQFGIGKASAGSLLLLNTFGIVVGSLVFGPVVDRWGYKEMLLVATAIVIVGLEGIAFAPSMTVLRVSVLLSGFGGGIINGGTNALVADISVEDRMAAVARLQVFFGVGAVGLPLTLGLLLGVFSHTTILAAVGATVLVPLVATAMTPFPAPKQAQGISRAGVSRLLRDPVLLTFGVMLFLESGNEITVGGWTTTYAKEELFSGDRSALIYLTLYWLGMTLGRVVLSVLLRAMNPLRLLAGCLTVALAGSFLLIATHSPALAAVAVFCLGAGFSATFPIVLGIVAGRHSALSGTAIGLMMAISLVGGMIVPWLTGILGAAYGLRGSFGIVPVGILLIGGLLLVVGARQAVEAGEPL